LLLVDTNVILDVVEDDPNWADWSQTQLEAAALQYTLLINPVIYAELSIAYRRIEELEVMLTTGGVRMEPRMKPATRVACGLPLTNRRAAPVRGQLQRPAHLFRRFKENN
jgi:predicted nucleic acid-binding protein